MVAAESVSRREFGLAALVAALLAFLPLAEGLLGRGVIFGVDSATTQLPWSAVIEQPGGEPAPERPRNPALSDQGLGFYPHYRWVSESWRAGDPPLWNPLIYAGVPALGNPQLGVLDPQIGILVGLEALFGRAAFDWGLGFTSWLRLAAALLGAWYLARLLGLGVRGAALAGLGFGFSGFQSLWLGFSLGHVSPCLPWILAGLESLRRGGGARSVLGIALATALSILAGHPETTFFVACAVVPWTIALLRRDPKLAAPALGGLASGALVCAPMGLPFLEYLPLSAAQLVREVQSQEISIDFVALGALLVVAGVVGVWRRGSARFAFLVPALVLGGAALLLARRGLPDSAGLTLFPDLFGFPGDGGGYRGPGSLAEEASAWLPAPVLVLALAGLLLPGGLLRRRALIAALAAGGTLLCLRAPGALDVYRHLPLVGLAATVRAGAVGGLMLALLAGEALEAARPAARRAAAATLVLWGALVLASGESAAPPGGVETGPETSELVVFSQVPDEVLGTGSIPFSGWVDGRVPFALARVRVQSVAEGAESGGELGAPYYFPVELGAAPAGAPVDARGFRATTLTALHFGEGLWRFDFELLDDTGAVLGERRVRVARIALERGLRPATAVVWGLSLAAVLLPAGAGLAGWSLVLVLVLAALQGSLFSRRANPAVPHAEVFPPTRAVELLQARLGYARYLGEPGVLPPSTGMVHGLRAADGYDGMDPTSFNVFRDLVVRPGTHALLGWGARGVDLDSPGFRLLGVDWLVTSAPLEHPRFELVAAPPGSGTGAPGAVHAAEVFLYRDRAPLPRAFVVGALRTADEVAANLAAWDPLESAIWEGAGELANPCTTWEIEDLVSSNNEVRLSVRLDGDGLLVLTEQHFPGWSVTVDGARAELAAADAIFRGVCLEAGEHIVVFQYTPGGLRLGLVLAALGALGLAFSARVARRAPETRREEGEQAPA